MVPVPGDRYPAAQPHGWRGRWDRGFEIVGRDWEAWVPGRTVRLGGLGRIIGHRGAAARAPENTLVSIRRARELGCRWVEFDVKLTADNVPILMHDERLRRTTDGRGRVKERSLAEIRDLDAGGWFGMQFAGERVPLLADAIRLLLELDMHANIEIKPCPGREAETASVVCALVRELWPPDRPPPLMSSFSIESLRAARDAAPELPRGYLVGGVPRDWRATVQECACVSLHVSYRRNSNRAMLAVAAEGIPLLCYTVNDSDEAAALFGIGAAAVITDTPDLLGASAQ
jgi:glycerophosphoryl diester phosphodiesterase